MGFFNWYKKHTPLYGIPTWVGEQYVKIDRMDSTLPESDIAKLIFFNRYERQDPKFSRKEFVRYSGYASSREEVINSLLELCFVILDIESEVDPSDEKLFTTTSEWYATKLQGAGVRVDLNSISQFITNWRKYIRPTRN